MRTLKGAGVSELLGNFYKGLRKRTRRVSHYIKKRTNPKEYEKNYHTNGDRKKVLNDNNASEETNNNLNNFLICFEDQIERVTKNIRNNESKIIWVKYGGEWFKFDNPKIIETKDGKALNYIIDDKHHQITINSGKQLGTSCDHYVLTDKEFRDLRYTQSLISYDKPRKFNTLSSMQSTETMRLPDFDNDSRYNGEGGKSRHRKIKKRKSANKTRRKI
jgi:hypothetical protein